MAWDSSSRSLQAGGSHTTSGTACKGHSEKKFFSVPKCRKNSFPPGLDSLPQMLVMEDKRSARGAASQYQYFRRILPLRKSKELLAGGIVRDLRFRSKAQYQAYLLGRKAAHEKYQVLDVLEQEDGAIIARILGQYNNAPLIKLFND